MRKLLTALLVALAAGCGENLTPTPHEDYRAGTVQPLACSPDLDGQIEAEEMQAAVGVPVSMLVSPAGAEVAVETAGGVDEAGRRFWDWSAERPEDQVARLSASPVSGKWYAASFPAGQFATSLDAGGENEAIYSWTKEALWLHGTASAKGTPESERTLLVYDKPVALFRFPIKPGAEWTSVGQVKNGLLRGLPWAQKDTYQMKVDAAGRLELPALTFTQAHRVRALVKVEPAVGTVVTSRQVSFLFECFGEVARATSRTGESDEDFTTAAEVRRLGL